MRCKHNIRFVLFSLAVFCLLVLIAGTGARSEESPYLSGLWLQKGIHQDGSLCWTLIEFNSNLTEPGVRGTGLGTRPDPMKIPTPEGGTMIMSEEMRATWVMEALNEYKIKVLVFIRSEGMVIGMAELTSTMIREAEDKMSAIWHMRIIDLEGNELAKLPSVEAELTRITVD